MVIVLMGVSGSGKSTVGKRLSRLLDCPFHDADDYHSASNKEKMGRGEPLSDEDRLPWLEALSKGMGEWNKAGPLSILACSALKKRYRDFLSQGVPIRWVYLKGDKELIRRRLEARKGHFVDEGLLGSQFEALEEPQDAVVVDIAGSVEEIAEDIVRKLGVKK